MSLEQMIADNLMYVQIVKVEHEGEVEYQILTDPPNAYFGCGMWRNTPEKVERLRELGMLHEFGPLTDCISKGGLIKIVEQGWITNDMTEIIGILRQRVDQHMKHNDAILDVLEDKNVEIKNLITRLKTLTEA